MNAVKIIILLLLSLIFISATACVSKKTFSNETETIFMTDIVDTEILAPEIPQKDYDGYIFTILTNDNYNYNFRLYMEDDGDTLNTASYQRSLALSEKYDIDFNIVENSSYTNMLKNSVLAADCAYDFILPHATVGVASMLTDKLLYNWNNLEYVDFTKPWWNSSMTENLSIGNNLFYVSGDIVLAW